jgi:hypothetical protein
MAAERLFIIRKLIERGIVKTVESAKKIGPQGRRCSGTSQNVLKGHPVLLNRVRFTVWASRRSSRLIDGKLSSCTPQFVPPTLTLTVTRWLRTFLARLAAIRSFDAHANST